MTEFKKGHLYIGHSGTVVRYTGRIRGVRGMYGTAEIVYCPYNARSVGDRWDALNPEFYKEITEEEAIMYTMSNDGAPCAS